jgi:TPP-dependent pyruvate/acetoin dehydrogenase alpha subunit
MTSLVELEKRYLALSPKPYAVPLGDLAPIVEACTMGMSKRNWIVTGPRARVTAMLRGCSAEKLMNLDGLKSYKIAPSSLSPANRALHAVGLALSCNQPVLCFLGQASAANGSFYEALNIAAIKKLPVIFVVIVQDLSSVPMSKQTAQKPSLIGKAMGLQSKKIAGSSTIQKTIEQIRKSKKPTLLEIHLEK